MKKSLLLAFVAMISFSANAQVKFAKIDLDNSVKSNTNRVENLSFNNTSKANAPILHAPGDGAVGSWIERTYSEETELFSCKLVKIEAASNVNNMPDANVKITLGEYKFPIWVYGTFADGKLTIPGQLVSDGAKETQVVNSQMYFCGIKADGQNLDNDKYEMTVNEDGALVPEEAYSGWYIYMTEGTYQGKGWDLGVDPEWNRSNGTMTGTRRFGQSGEEEFNLPVFVKDEEGNYGIYNAFINLKMTLEVDKAAGTFKITTPQNVAATSQKLQDQGYGKYYYIRGTDNNGYFQDNVPVKGTWTENLITFNVPQEGDYSGVYQIVTSAAADGGRYGYGYFLNVIINYGNNPAGIEDVATDASKKDNRIFNLAGQQVGNDYKGIVIQNGVKKIQK